MRDADREHVALALWICLWIVTAALSHAGQAILLGWPEMNFQCPWTLLGVTELPAGLVLWLFQKCLSCRGKKSAGAGQANGNSEPLLGNRSIRNPEAEMQKQMIETAEKKQMACRVGKMALLQGLEIGLGNVVQTGLSRGFWNACDMMTPLIALGFAFKVKQEKVDRWLLLCAVSAAIGGCLAVPENYEVSDWAYLIMALLVRVIAVTKWMTAQAWMHSLDEKAPDPVTLANITLCGAGALGLELTCFVGQIDCFWSFISLEHPTVYVIVAIASFLSVFQVIAEFKTLHAPTCVSPILLGFLLPARCMVLLIVDAFIHTQETGLWWGMHWFGVGVTLLTAISFCALRREVVDWPQSLRQELDEVKVTKTIIQKGDQETYPRRDDKVTIEYVGTIAESGQKFDQNEIEFVIGKGQVIAGWDKAVLRMTIGEKAVLDIDSAAAYGRVGMRDPMGEMLIPSNADLRFKVYLKRIQRLETDQLNKQVWRQIGFSASKHGCLQM